LPQDYKGYSTAELLKEWVNIPNNRYTGQPQTAEETRKILAMRGLLMEYRLAPVHWGFVKKEQGYLVHAGAEQEKADIIRSRKLLAPFGIDPAPWADETGNELPPNKPTASS
jgi:hypothetical protein